MSLQVTGSFTANGHSHSLSPHKDLQGNGEFVVSVRGLTGATVTLERSLDDGATWGAAQSMTEDKEYIAYEPSSKAIYRLTCSDYASGTITYDMGL